MSIVDPCRLSLARAMVCVADLQHIATLPLLLPIGRATASIGIEEGTPRSQGMAVTCAFVLDPGL